MARRRAEYPALDHSSAAVRALCTARSTSAWSQGGKLR
ncbi:hypothetical protein I552_2078 [Mycobacterium xenopi 3993]|nr:hypothetical protein I552_2078 [Mycobacterium xenopi 3993]